MVAERIVADVAKLAIGHAWGSPIPTIIPRVAVWCSSAPTGPKPAMLEPKFYIVLQGAKRLTFGSKTLEFTAGSYSVSTVGLPFTAQVTAATPETPYLGVSLRLDPSVVGSLLLDVQDLNEPDAPAIAIAQADEAVGESIDRVLRLLTRPVDIPVLAPQFERELCYRLLQGAVGGTLRQIVQRNTRFDRIRAAAEWLRGNANKPMCVSELAGSVGMSVTSFHRHFKAATGYSPLAYQRQVRLLEARRLLASGAANVTAAAFETGYANCSQFSREYKRMFGVSPNRDAVHLQRSAGDSYQLRIDRRLGVEKSAGPAVRGA